MPHCCLSKSAAGGHLLSVKISHVHIGQEPSGPCWCTSTMLRGHTNTASVCWLMGQLTHTMRPAFGSHSKCFVFRIHPPCATTFLLFSSRKISGMTFNQPHREMRRMRPPWQRFIKENSVRNLIFCLVVNKHSGLGPPC